MVLPRRALYRVLQAILASTLIAALFFYFGPQWPLTNSILKPPTKSAVSCFADDNNHPIDQLICDANAKYRDLLTRQTSNIARAARAYRERRGRHPPPGFDKWVQFARSKKALIIEELFDRIYDDLEPFWGLSPRYIRLFTRQYNTILTIRNGTIGRWKTTPVMPIDALRVWSEMIEPIPAGDLPDVDMAFNVGDEPHLFVDSNLKEMHLKAAASTRHIRMPEKTRPIITEFTIYPPLNEDYDPEGHTMPMVSRNDTIWGFSKAACTRESSGYDYEQDFDMTQPAPWPSGREPHFHRGFVQDWPAAQNACENPYISNMHGALIAMQAVDVSNNPTVATNGFIWTQLVPLFSYAKINGINSDILVPGAVYWSSANKDFDLADNKHVPWQEKTDHFRWYGSASGGWNNETNWTRFQRHRLVSMLNGTQVHATEVDMHNHGQIRPDHVPSRDSDLPYNFPLPDPHVYDLAATKSWPSSLGQWIKNLGEGRMVDLRCFPVWEHFTDNSADCSYSGRFYDVVPKVPHHDNFLAKYLPDLDGSSFSGRYLSLVESDSVPIKATVFSEWHDSRLIPWQHFVPMDNSMVDLWGIQEYFLGHQDSQGEWIRPSHDRQGKELGKRGKEWVKMALRPEDMTIYMYRLILEFARISDDHRVDMGFVSDLL